MPCTANGLDKGSLSFDDCIHCTLASLDILAHRKTDG